ncbi:MAG: hypothetical protein RL088_1114, partial [Verrucomicrobiota bacterium]
GQATEPQLNPPTPASAQQDAQSPPRPRTLSIVGTVRSEDAMTGFEENTATTRRMVASVVKTATGKATVEDAWRSLASPDDRVGIKVTAAGGRYFSTRRGVVIAVIEGLKSAGVPEKNIFVWDRDAAALKEAGFTPERMGCEVRSISQPKDWERDTPLVAPVLGQLIWGDAQFTERLNALNPAESDQLSSKSHLCRMLARDATKWINIPALSDAPGTGVHGTFYSAVVANIDNWRRFTTAGLDGANALPDLYTDPRIGGKCVLHILDALAVTYAGGPAANPHFANVHSTLYASRDPVALDALGARLLDGWRSNANLPVLGAKVAWLQGAANIGNFEESMIRLVAGK